MDNHEQHVIKIVGALGEVFNEESEHFIAELEKVDLTEFFTAATAALGVMFNHYTGEQKNAIDFTHVLNGLAVRRALENATKEAGANG
ncbi:hypothetical protein FO510_05430 [Bacillus pumilus]|uniref:hypothetical protein n=1 Tax=Bacillus pumilus TaxID=1408 RepID=UPI00017A5FBB|nr:hypothetical protein [Bacillus pumilus]EDW22492.1 conserved hypothetical protein [Bacillus pumilus ATCC 7061]MCR4352194.1 hypothetical protein [Bacillus pumilus]MCY7504005.1 hypothetical protein [Bacillus pumilus]MDR4269006.1 hypothetical protein [Bacillus pumilus]MDR4269093.1 hypothetical protein [Bacillus pumilus]